MNNSSVPLPIFFDQILFNSAVAMISTRIDGGSELSSSLAKISLTTCFAPQPRKVENMMSNANYNEFSDAVDSNWNSNASSKWTVRQQILLCLRVTSHKLLLLHQVYFA